MTAEESLRDLLAGSVRAWDRHEGVSQAMTWSVEAYEAHVKAMGEGER